MPAKPIKGTSVGNGYFHIYNQGVSGNLIFQDEQDYQVFLDCLNDYLTPQSHPDTYKKEFTIKGKTFSGIPHRIKNYSDSIHLMAYRLKSNHFHLLLYPTNQKYLERFMRSLSTRYSIYFNKKYRRSGPVFNGPYKSVCVRDTLSLLHLSRYIHRGYSTNINNLIKDYTSYPNYIGKKDTKWIKTDIILSFFGGKNGEETTASQRMIGYKNFIEKYEPNENDRKLLEKIIIEKEFSYPENNTTRQEEYPQEEKLKENLNFTSVFLSTTAFIVLFSVGLKNVVSYSSNNVTTIYGMSSKFLDGINGVLDATSGQIVGGYNKIRNTSFLYLFRPKDKDNESHDKNISIDNKTSPYASSDSAYSLSSSPEPLVAGTSYNEGKTTSKIKLNSKLTDADIFEGPSFDSPIIGNANDGDIFEIVSINADWYEIKLADESIGYIRSENVEEIK